MCGLSSGRRPISLMSKSIGAITPGSHDVLEKERLHALATLPEVDYENIWEGKSTAGRLRRDLRHRGRANVRGTSRHSGALRSFLLVHVVFDLGWNDHMAIIMAQRHIS